MEPSPTTQDDLCCVISFDRFHYPVIDNEGHRFERNYIMEWLKNNKTCPIGREKLQAEDLVLDYDTMKKIEKLEEKNNKEVKIILEQLNKLHNHIRKKIFLKNKLSQVQRDAPLLIQEMRKMREKFSTEKLAEMRKKVEKMYKDRQNCIRLLYHYNFDLDGILENLCKKMNSVDPRFVEETSSYKMFNKYLEVKKMLEEYKTMSVTKKSEQDSEQEKQNLEKGQKKTSIYPTLNESDMHISHVSTSFGTKIAYPTNPTNTQEIAEDLMKKEHKHTCSTTRSSSSDSLCFSFDEEELRTQQPASAPVKDPSLNRPIDQVYMDFLVESGFTNIKKNKKYLKRYGYDINRVVDKLSKKKYHSIFRF